MPSKATLIRAYRGDAGRGPQFVLEPYVPDTALLSTRLFGPKVSIARASRWIRIIAVVLREGVTSQDELCHDLEKRWSRATISRDLRDMVERKCLFRPEFAGASHRVKWIAMDRSAAHRFYGATQKTCESRDPVGEVRELRRRRRAPADQRRRARSQVKPQVATAVWAGPIIRYRRGARPRWLRKRPTWLAA